MEVPFYISLLRSMFAVSRSFSRLPSHGKYIFMLPRFASFCQINQTKIVSSTNMCTLYTYTYNMLDHPWHISTKSQAQ